METVNVATLKQKLSAYLRRVEQGTDVVVTSHRRPIARLLPEDDSRLTIRPPSLPVSALTAVRGVRPAKAASTERLLLADRERR